MLIILDGAVSVTDVEGRLLRELGSGAVIGELSIILDSARTSTCTATTAGSLLQIGRADFQALLLEHPSISLG